MPNTPIGVSPANHNCPRTVESSRCSCRLFVGRVRNPSRTSLGIQNPRNRQAIRATSTKSEFRFQVQPWWRLRIPGYVFYSHHSTLSNIHAKTIYLLTPMTCEIAGIRPIQHCKEFRHQWVCALSHQGAINTMILLENIVRHGQKTLSWRRLMIRQITWQRCIARRPADLGACELPRDLRMSNPRHGRNRTRCGSVGRREWHGNFFNSRAIPSRFIKWPLRPGQLANRAIMFATYRQDYAPRRSLVVRSVAAFAKFLPDAMIATAQGRRRQMNERGSTNWLQVIG